jgi:hypothetical protein
VVAATAAAAAIVSVATVRVVDRGRDDDAVPAGSAVSEVVSAPMVGTGETPVGWAFVSDGEPAAVGIAVGYLLASGDYTIEVVRGDGTPREIGTMTVADGRGVWSGTVKAPKERLALIYLVDAAGEVVCQATLV